MSCKTVQVVIAMVATLAAVVVVEGAPSRQRKNTLYLHEAQNMTTCPIQVHINENAKRVPRLVKELKCRNQSAQSHRAWCDERGISKQECCAGADHHELSCEEIRDTVTVYYPEEHVRKQEPFSVGCVCTVRRALHTKDENQV